MMAGLIVKEAMILEVESSVAISKLNSIATIIQGEYRPFLLLSLKERLSFYYIWLRLSAENDPLFWLVRCFNPS